MTRNPTVRIATRILPGDAERSDAVIEALREPCGRLRANYGNTALLDGLLSLYASLAIQSLGVANTEAALKKMAKNLPRLAATLAAAKAGPAGRA